MPAELGLGTAALGRPGYINLNHAADLGGDYDPQAMELRAHTVLDAAFESGVRYFDVARSYGRAEEFLGSWLDERQIEPGRVTVASKWGYTYTAGWSTNAEQHEIKDHSLRNFTKQFSESVERLGGHLSIYQIHSVTAEGKTLDDDALIDAIARLREKGIRAGLTVSGPGQNIAIRKAVDVRRDGERVFDSVQATWNLFERGAESALSDAHSAGMRVVIKEALANGRLTNGNRESDGILAPRVEAVRRIAEKRRTTIDMLALSAALSRPWADIVLSGAATVGQLEANIAALEFGYDADLDEQLRASSVGSADYWRARAAFGWN
ncbi:MAG TPA: aldo/keto reductase [Gemmatimonadaceae bacterium]|nr:aldo/keto reductase [Gemmatimonadaceae bacterium]